MIKIGNEIKLEQKYIDSREIKNLSGFQVIHGYDNLYCVNRDGVVVSPSYVDKTGKLRKQKILAKSKRGKGYYCVGLMKNGKQVRVSLHRLVAEAFIPNPNNLPQVNHIDGNKENNRADNLEWCSNRENVLHAFKEKLRVPTCHIGEKNTMAKLNEEAIKIIRKSNKCVKELSEDFNVSVSCIYKIKSNARWKHLSTD